MPPLVIVPTVAFPPVIPLTAQVTAVFALPDTAAPNVCEAPSATVADTGDTETVTVGSGACNVTVAVPNDVDAAAETAFTTMVDDAGRLIGAV